MAGKLAAYYRKRDFAQTPEPKGSVTPHGKSLRYVIQKHAARSLHYDFRLELDGTLKSWAVPKGPSLDPAEKRLAVHVEDHPLQYGEFEGTIPEGNYGAGQVEIWDRGAWRPGGNARADYRAGKLKFRLEGEKLHGGWTLVRTRLRASGDKEQWLLIKERDEFARPAQHFSVTDAMPDSVLKRKGRAREANRAQSASTTASATPARERAQSPRRRPSVRARPEVSTPECTGVSRVAGILITHPRRVIDKHSGCTKLDLARYYERVSDLILPELIDRPVALLRGPSGAQGELFFQKHVQRLKIPGIRELAPRYDPGHPPLMVIDSPEALIGAVQFGAIEFHTWGATTRAIEKPDRMIFDLDPDPALPWKTVVVAAQLVRSLLHELGLPGTVKTSGGNGLHITVPLARRNSWDEVGSYAQAVSRYLATTLPDRFSAKAGPKNRVGRVFVDYLRNHRGSSTVAAYSARARPGLPVSVPLHWDALDSVKDANQWNIRTLSDRLSSSPRIPAVPSAMITRAMQERLGVSGGDR